MNTIIMVNTIVMVISACVVIVLIASIVYRVTQKVMLWGSNQYLQGRLDGFNTALDVALSRAEKYGYDKEAIMKIFQ